MLDNSFKYSLKHLDKIEDKYRSFVFDQKTKVEDSIVSTKISQKKTNNTNDTKEGTRVDIKRTQSYVNNSLITLNEIEENDTNCVQPVSLEAQCLTNNDLQQRKLHTNQKALIITNDQMWNIYIDYAIAQYAVKSKDFRPKSAKKKKKNY
jgi:hypothetical protein